MPKITFVTPTGEEIEVDARSGTTVMENATRNDVEGIDAECGGACACATCHVYVDEAWTDTLAGPEAMEEDMLDFAYEPQPNSRLSCQIIMRDDLDGLKVRVPEKQA
ncbi:2Fe-2S ferredoxin [Fulvimarina endophytica]|uniref:2Fe-2S ferredoxin n=1 Tax=Fulvimarina endophytica TaxID=2293836 RepID=A0A371X782_9HYPH|nr:2Fe-2S iron-sulfur cluster-binding protein [Fulvimarina endophytica]RFC65067.1 2Fe-2S ferredoxin [Fulvimarina endophytica]